MSDAMAERWFGQSWGATCCEPSAHVTTPVGQPCMRCREPIKLGDQGLVHPHVHEVIGGHVAYSMEPIHVACLVRSIRPHGPECPHCRGKEPDAHAPDCQRTQTGICSCTPMPEGKP